MRILLDESLPRGLKGLLPGLDVTTVPERGWQGVRNGELLALAGLEFDVFLTADRNLEYQQNIAAVPIAIIVLLAVSNRLESYAPMASEIRRAIEGAPRGAVTRVTT